MEKASGDRGEGRGMGGQGLPGWLGQGPAHGRLPLKGRKKAKFIGRTLAASARFMEDLFFNERLCRKKGFLQAVEPRIKLISILLMLVAISLRRSWAEVLPFVIFALLLALCSGIPVLLYAKRVLPGTLLTALVAAPALLSPVLRGDPLARLFSFSGHVVFITRQGAESAVTLVARVTASLMLVALAGLTTEPSDFIRSGAALLPGPMKTLFSVSYRYIYLLVLKLEEYSLACQARVFYSFAPGLSRRWTGSRGAGLFLIALGLKDDLSICLEARGAGLSVKEPPQGPLRLEIFDFLFIVLSAGVILYAYI